MCAVGNHTRWYKEHPVEDLEDDNNLTLLQTKLDNMAKYIGKWSYIAGFVTFFFMVTFLFSKILFTDAALLEDSTLQKLLRSFTTAMAIIIVSVPEGLPLAVSIAMAFSVDYMKKDNLLVKKMSSVETLGHIRDICTGKTATLTQNDQHVRKFYTGERQFDFGDKKLNDVNEELKNIIVDSIIYNTDARVEMSEDGYFEPVGNGTEVALLRFLQENELPVHTLLTQRQRTAEHECSIPFSPIRKCMTTVYRPYHGCDYVLVVMKGAPEVILPKCNQYFDSQGQSQYLGPEMRDVILNKEIIEEYASGFGYRTFAYSYKKINSDYWEKLQHEYNNFVDENDRFIVEEEMIFVAGFGIQDDLRPGVKDSVAKLKLSKVNVRMISGDNL